MKEHTGGKSFLDVSDLDWQLGREVLAVNLDHSWVRLVVAPNQQLGGDEVELSACLEVERLVLLDWHQRNLQQVGTTWDVPLEIH